MPARVRNKRVIEIDDLLGRLKAIEKEMPQDVEKPKKNRNVQKDRFLEVKSEFLDGMLIVKNNLKEMKDSKNMTRTREQISKTQQVRAQLKDLSKLFHEMETLFSKEERKKKSKLGPEELENRREFLRQFKVDLEALKRLSTKSFGMGSTSPSQDEELEFGSISSSGFNTDSFFKSLPQPGASQSHGGGGGGGSASAKEVELTDMQQQSLDQIKARDQKFDEILDLIDQQVELAREKANVMSDEINLQDKMLDNLEKHVDDTTAKIRTLNESMKKNLESKGMGFERFCINMMCCIILLGVVGLIVNLVA